jgi:prevent-host-death family protein
VKFATSSELNQNSTHVLKEVTLHKDDVIITKNGKPVAMIIPMSEDALEDYILAKHFGLDKQIIDSRECETLDEAFNEIEKEISTKKRTERQTKRKPASSADNKARKKRSSGNRQFLSTGPSIHKRRTKSKA